MQELYGIIPKFFLKSITLENYHGISGYYEIDKTNRIFSNPTMLSAIQMLLSTYFKAFSTYIPDKYTIKLKPKDALAGTKQNWFCINEKETACPCRVTGIIVFNDQEIEIGQELSQNGRVKFIGLKELQSIISTWEMKFSKADNSDKDILFPVLLYCNPAAYKIPKQIYSKGVYHRFVGYKDCFIMNRSLEIPFSYLRMLRNVAFEERDNVDFPAYTKIMEAANQVVTDGKLIYGNYGTSLVTVKKEDKLIPFEELSIDQQIMIGLVLDIATRVCILNPYAKDQALQETPGIILLDGLDECFSPAQGKALFNLLQSELPNIQFLSFEYERELTFDDAFPDGRYTVPASDKDYRLRDAITKSRSLGRPLTEKEMQEFEIGKE